MSANDILLIIIIILSVEYFFDQILDYLNLKNQKPGLPEELSDIYKEEKYKKSLAYQRTNTRFSSVTSTFSFALFIVILLTGFLGVIDQLIAAHFEHLIIQALVFFGLIFIASDILNTPFQIYHTFVIEEKFGFNKTTLKLFIVDKLKGYLLTAIIGGAILSLLLYLIISIGPDFWIYFLVAIAAFMVFVNMFYTTLIVPLFNKLTPLEDDELKSAIEDYSAKVNFPLKNVFVIDGSKRSSKANAFFSGIGKKKKIVLYDTLIEKHSIKELVAILAHEVGHYKKKHVYTGLLLSILQSGLMLYVMSWIIYNPEISQALGANRLSLHLNILAFGILYSPISKFLGVLMNVFSRKNEYEADQYATETYDGSALQTALKKLSVDNLSNLLPHRWYVFFHYSHPPLLKRLKHIESIKKS